MSKVDEVVENFTKTVVESVNALDECDLVDAEQEPALRSCLDAYKQDHNPDHLFDYLNSLHAEFVKGLSYPEEPAAEPLAPAAPEGEDAAQAMVPATAAPAVEPAPAEQMIPAEVVVKQEEMKIEPPVETAADAE